MWKRSMRELYLRTLGLFIFFFHHSTIHHVAVSRSFSSFYKELAAPSWCMANSFIEIVEVSYKFDMVSESKQIVP